MHKLAKCTGCKKEYKMTELYWITGYPTCKKCNDSLLKDK